MHVCEYIDKVYGLTPAPEEDYVKVLKFDYIQKTFIVFATGSVHV